jgi:acylphosphatase
VTRAVQVSIRGRVQGVSFRWYAVREASRLGLAGWVRNEADGSVAAHLEGPEAAVEEMLAWCRHGPPSAAVAHVAVTEVPQTGGTSFEVDY